ncbi:unnamed protein product [Adineta steineri]|uniref:Uncharacterized protein n=1 Tax=Adineta steineri TaxID=433720 RepID=A0A815DPF4_9BILA|nr:unnamed protein product [Adineta steineri]CAF1300528.1 unnamed protein product [Adineta steineri]
MSSSELEYDHMIVWLDQNIASADCCRQLKKAFSTTINPENRISTNIDELDICNLIRENSINEQTSFLEVPFIFRLFSDVEPCLEFLIENARKKRIFFLTSGSLGEKIVPKILDEHQEIFQDENNKLYEDSIYIFCADMVKHGQWAIEYLELDCIKMENDDQTLLSRLTRDIAKYFLFKGKQFKENSNNLLSSLEKATKYFTWAKELYHRAQTIIKTHTSTNMINEIDQLIIQTQFQIKQIKNDNDDEQFGEEN